MEKISAVYQIINSVTGDRYVGSSKDVKHRWENHKCPSRWKKEPNKSLYQDMQKYGLDKFRFQILAPVMPEYLAQVEQEFIDLLHPTYNKCNAKGRNVERQKEANKRYNHKLCEYNGETLKFLALAVRFMRAGIKHPRLEAKKYLIKS